MPLLVDVVSHKSMAKQSLATGTGLCTSTTTSRLVISAHFTLFVYLHIGSPSNHVSGLECSSMRTVGMHTISTNKSAIDRLMRNKLVEFLRYFVLITTSGTRRFPQTPTLNMSKQNSVAMILI